MRWRHLFSSIKATARSVIHINLKSVRYNFKMKVFGLFTVALANQDRLEKLKVIENSNKLFLLLFIRAIEMYSSNLLGITPT